MHFIHTHTKKIIFAFCATLFSNITIAQDTAKEAVKPESSSNLLSILLIVTTLILAFVIWGMGQALIVVGKLVLDKRKQSSQVLSILFLLSFTLLSDHSFAQDTASIAIAASAPNYGGLSAITFYLFVTVILIEVITILFLAFFIRRIYAELMPEKVNPKVSRLKNIWASLDKKIFTKAVPVEKEADVMLDHDYDGIRELDNGLPPWWKYGFYITIAVAFVYLINFHVLGSGKNPTQEYEAEMENARIQKELYEAQNKDKIDENNVPMADAAGLQKAKELFLTDCWACHGKLGEGGAGPNFTDDYWLHKGSLNDIYQSIKNGYPDKGMQSWSVKYNPKEISLLASYIRSLHGTNPPNAKAPQGDLYSENATIDSTNTRKTDSVIVIKK